ncbi:hypothetical protein PGT21_027255 [Puccinia graminis f. sp. tritici]|uniref:Uncharacterized protein n=1 Tax=Puccinia graminis f. sp. tritici TaxID=56615 RepID=A0A5B0QNP3_PUCGR|nr:hypothetical protein PGT21_027255 [Puccinia graminis f. sp. tritici]
MVGPHPDIRSDADIRWQFQRNCTSASAPAPASGYPSAAAGILRYPPSKGPATDRLEGLPSSRGYPLGYPDTRQQFAEKGPSAPESAPAGGYPPADNGYPRRIPFDHLYLSLVYTICLFHFGKSNVHCVDEVGEPLVIAGPILLIIEQVLWMCNGGCQLCGHN